MFSFQETTAIVFENSYLLRVFFSFELPSINCKQQGLSILGNSFGVILIRGLYHLCSFPEIANNLIVDLVVPFWWNFFSNGPETCSSTIFSRRCHWKIYLLSLMHGLLETYSFLTLKNFETEYPQNSLLDSAPRALNQK